MKLNALKPVRINGEWVEKGQPVPADVAGFDYEAAARRGLIEDVDGGEIRNVTPTATESPADGGDLQTALAEQQTAAQRWEQLANEAGAKITALTQDREALDRQLATERQEVQRLATLVNDGGANLARLTQERDELQVKLDAAAADAEALAEYREVVGDLLPAGYPERKILLGLGYYTVDSVADATDADLEAEPGIGKKKVEAIRAVTPYAPSEGE